MQLLKLYFLGGAFVIIFVVTCIQSNHHFQPRPHLMQDTRSAQFMVSLPHPANFGAQLFTGSSLERVSPRGKQLIVCVLYTYIM